MDLVRPPRDSRRFKTWQPRGADRRSAFDDGPRLHQMDLAAAAALQNDPLHVHRGAILLLDLDRDVGHLPGKLLQEGLVGAETLLRVVDSLHRGTTGSILQAVRETRQRHDLHCMWRCLLHNEPVGCAWLICRGEGLAEADAHLQVHRPRIVIDDVLGETDEGEHIALERHHRLHEDAHCNAFEERHARRVAALHGAQREHAAPDLQHGLLQRRRVLAIHAQHGVVEAGAGDALEVLAVGGGADGHAVSACWQALDEIVHHLFGDLALFHRGPRGER
mmetsp:Transcript_23361/g.75575  ORF Transcript_23361/g.75575 Transcript_23361/m.75575 type:complete len:277 (+) Transcript_23361:69-899(+)